MNQPEPKPVLTGWALAVVVVVVYCALEFSQELLLLLGVDGYRSLLNDLPRPLRYAEQPVRWTLGCALALLLLHRVRFRNLLTEVGLWAPPHWAFLFAFVVTLPMLVPPAVVGKVAADLDPLYLTFGCLIWPLAEEILYRGYVFRQLHRRAGWNLWTAAAFSSLLFGAAHLGNAAVQQQPLSGQFGTVAMLTVLSMLGAWMFTRWDDNLWVLIALHALMNLWWAIFELSDNPLGGWWANGLRMSTVALAIGVTYYRREILEYIARWRAKTHGQTNTDSMVD